MRKCLRIIIKKNVKRLKISDEMIRYLVFFDFSSLSNSATAKIIVIARVKTSGPKSFTLHSSTDVVWFKIMIVSPY